MSSEDRNLAPSAVPAVDTSPTTLARSPSWPSVYDILHDELDAFETEAIDEMLARMPELLNGERVGGDALSDGVMRVFEGLRPREALSESDNKLNRYEDAAFDAAMDLTLSLRNGETVGGDIVSDGMKQVYEALMADKALEAAQNEANDNKTKDCEGGETVSTAHNAALSNPESSTTGDNSARSRRLQEIRPKLLGDIDAWEDAILSKSRSAPTIGLMVKRGLDDLFSALASSEKEVSAIDKVHGSGSGSS